jgi:hypothetical protein
MKNMKKERKKKKEEKEKEKKKEEKKEERGSRHLYLTCSTSLWPARVSHRGATRNFSGTASHRPWPLKNGTT